MANAHTYLLIWYLIYDCGVRHIIKGSGRHRLFNKSNVLYFVGWGRLWICFKLVIQLLISLHQCWLVTQDHAAWFSICVSISISLPYFIFHPFIKIIKFDIEWRIEINKAAESSLLTSAASMSSHLYLSFFFFYYKTECFLLIYMVKTV